MSKIASSLRWALIGSLLLHVFLLLPLANFSWPENSPTESRLDALLLPAPPAKPKPSSKHPKRAQAPLAKSPTGVPRPEAVPRTEQASPPLDEIEPAPASSAATSMRKMPGSGQLVFVVNKGEGRFPVGRATHRWSIDGNRYAIQSRIETTGIVALFADVQLAQFSAGRIDATGLVPETFRDLRKGKEYFARFAWDEQKLFLSEEKQLPLLAGTQDVLSMIYQFSMLPLTEPEFTLPVSNGRKLASYVFKVSEDEVELPDGSTLAAFHLAYQGSDGEGVEVWLARDMARLPVRIRYIDRKGGMTELLATDINFRGKDERTAN